MGVESATESAIEIVSSRWTHDYTVTSTTGKDIGIPVMQRR